MVASSQKFLYQIEIDPKRDESLNLAFCSQSIANSQVAGDVLFPATVARHMQLMSETANKKRSSSETQ